MLPITAIVVNFRTPLLLTACVKSFVACYPDVDLVIVDNGSVEGSLGDSEAIIENQGRIFVRRFVENLGHGPALDWAFRNVLSPFILTLDSDCVVKQGGFLEAMLEEFRQDELLFAMGWLRWVDPNGVALNEAAMERVDSEALDPARFAPYIHPAVALYRRDIYLRLPPFSQQGAPAATTMWQARVEGYRVKDFPVWDYVEHLVAGTRRMFGGRWDPKDGESPVEWQENHSYPI